MKIERISKTIDEIIKAEDAGNRISPLPIGVIPNYMGINLCSVHGLSWVKQEDGQLVSLTIDFMPATKDEEEALLAFLESAPRVEPT